MSTLFHSAVATDVIVNPAALSGAQRKVIKERSDTPDVYIDYMPRNTVLGVLVGKGQGRLSDSYMLFYPFFSSHFSLPIKPGEMIWVLFPEGKGSGSIGYWLTRRHGPQTIEDPNYTHLERWSSSIVPVIKEAPSGTPVVIRPDYKVKGVLAFPKGGRGDPQKNTLSDANDYEAIWGGSLAVSHFTGEPVTRFSKRCGDTVIQGSNNARIVLGENRQGTTDKLDPTTMDATPIPGPPVPASVIRMQQVNLGLRPTTDVVLPGTAPLATPLNGGLGTIDIVAGAGKRIISPGLVNDPTSPVTSAAIAPHLPPVPGQAMPPVAATVKAMAPPAMNTRGFLENAKVPAVNHLLEDNPFEGDPHFETDLARLYVSMRCNVDVAFGIDGHTILEPLSMAAADPALCSILPYTAGVGASCVVGHADHIRMIARSTGTVKIIKKGPVPMSGGAGPGDASLIMDPAGNVQLCGTTIHLGNSIVYGGIPPVTPKIPPMGEPYLLHSQIDAILTEITTALTDIATDLTMLQTVGALSGMTAGPYPVATPVGTVLAGITSPAKIAKAVGAVTALKILMGSKTIYGA